MTIASVALTICIVVLLPIIVGACFVSDRFSEKLLGKILWSWLFGQLLLWCVFQCIAVYDVLVSNVLEYLIKRYTLSCAGLATMSILVLFIRYFISSKKARAGGNQNPVKVLFKKNERSEKWQSILWLVFAVILLVQMVLICTLSYVDGDDSFYVTIAGEAVGSGHMFWFSPYTGTTIGYDMRHDLAPFSIWIALLSGITGIHSATMAHVLLPLLMLPLTYGVYALFGARILSEKKKYLPVFMLVIELMVLFSGYSMKNPEKFLISRIRQGKASLATLIIPVLLMLLFMMLEDMKEKRRIDFRLFVLLLALNTAGCLCSTIGALLLLIPIAFVGIAGAIAYKRGWHLIPMALCCAPNLIFAAMYILE